MCKIGNNVLFYRGNFVLLYVTFCVYLEREILFLSGKSQGILHTDFCGSHDKAACVFLFCL